MLNLLKGVRILDLTSVVLGPYASQMLGDLGAEVLKIEPLSGDLFRSVRPGRSAEMGAGYLNCNRNKSSLAVDLKRTGGRDLLRTLVASADVLMHNMRAASAAALGLTFEALAQINPRIVYCQAPGFGSGGPYEGAPSYDDVIQALSGLAHLNRDTSGEPRFVPTIICDKIGGLHLTIAVLGGLVQRLTTGKGCSIEAPMFESMVSFLMVEQLAGQTFLPALGPTGYERLQSRRPFRTADGYIAIVPYNTKHWTDFFTLIGQEALTREARVVDPVERSRRVGELYQIVAAVTPSRATSEWLAALRALDVPCAPVNRVEDLLGEPHLTAMRYFESFDHPSEGPLRMVRSPFSVKAGEAVPDIPAPRLGENTARILAAAGLSPAQLQTLVDDGVIAMARATDGEERGDRF